MAEFERNLKMIDVVTKFQSVKLADDVDFDARQVEADVKIPPVEDESRAARGARASVSATRSLRARAADDRGEE